MLTYINLLMIFMFLHFWMLKPKDTCFECLENDSKKWWLNTFTNEGKCWKNSDEYKGCGGDQYDVCTTKSGDDNSAYFTCPSDDKHCNTQNFNTSQIIENELINIQSDEIDDDAVCWYRILSDTEQVTKLRFKNGTFFKADAEIYYYKNQSLNTIGQFEQIYSLSTKEVTDEGDFVFRYNFETNETYEMSISLNDSIYVLVLPEDHDAQAQFLIEINKDVKKDEMNLILPIWAWILLSAFVLLISFCFALCLRHIRKKKSESITESYDKEFGLLTKDRDNKIKSKLNREETEVSGIRCFWLFRFEFFFKKLKDKSLLI